MSTNNIPVDASLPASDRSFTAIDFPSDPVNDLTSPWIISEKDLTDKFNKVTEEDIAEDREDRALHGVSRRNIWNFNSHWVAIVAIGSRKLAESAGDAKTKELYEDLTEGTIAFNEFSMGETNDLAVYANPEAYQAEVERWTKVWKPKSERFRAMMVEHWAALPSEGKAWAQDDLDAIAAVFEGDFTYDEAMNLIPDPITPVVPAENRAEHFEQRRLQGYSDWDIKGLRLFLIWITAQASVFLTSSVAAGYPPNKDAGINSFEDYVKVQRERILELLRGEIRFANSGTADAPYMTAVSEMLEYIPHMWD